jgi:hypothetical protein
VILALGVGLIAITALNHPKGRETARATSVPTSSASVAKPSSSAPKKPAPTAPSATPKPAPKTSSPPTPTAITRPSVLVLDNTSTASGVATALSRLRAGGWTASSGGTFDGSILSTAVYYDPAVTGADQAATALQAQFPAILRVKPKFSGLPQGALILILTSDYS